MPAIKAVWFDPGGDPSIDCARQSLKDIIPVIRTLNQERDSK